MPSIAQCLHEAGLDASEIAELLPRLGNSANEVKGYFESEVNKLKDHQEQLVNALRPKPTSVQKLTKEENVIELGEPEAIELGEPIQEKQVSPPKKAEEVETHPPRAGAVEEVAPEKAKKPEEKLTPPKGLVEKDGEFYRSDGKPFSSETVARLVSKRVKREDLVPKKVEGGYVLVPGEPISGQKLTKEEAPPPPKETKPEPTSVQKLTIEEIKDVNKFRRDVAKRAKEIIKSKSPKPEEVDELEDAVSRLINSRSPEDFKEDWEYDEFNDLNNTLLDVVRRAREKVGGEPLEVVGAKAPDVEDVLDLDSSNKKSIDDYLKEHGGVITLDSMGLQQVYEKSVEALKKTPEAYEHLKRIARGVVYEGKTKFSDFKSRMKEILGDVYEKVKGLLIRAWKDAREWNRKLGERGFFGSVEGALALENKRYAEIKDRMDQLRDWYWGEVDKGRDFEDLKKDPRTKEFERLRKELLSIPTEPDTLKKAERLERQGVDMMEIFRRTGWFKGLTDKRWRFEIDDRKAKIDTGKLGKNGSEYKLPEVLKLDRLYEAYPKLKETKVMVGGLINEYGNYNGRTNTIRINPNFEDLDLSLLHETQHAIQEIEGLPRGGSSRAVPGPKTTRKYLKAKYGDDYDYLRRLTKDADSLLVQILADERRLGYKTRFSGSFESGMSDLRARGMNELASKWERYRHIRSLVEMKSNKDFYDVYKEFVYRDPSAYDVYRKLIGEIGARDVEMRHKLTDLRNVSPALLTERGIEVYDPAQVTEKVSERVSREDKKLTRKAIEKREEKLKATDLDLRDIVDLARAKNFDAEFIRRRMKSKFGKASLRDLTHDEADELKLNLARETPVQKNQVVEYVKSLKGVRESAKKRFDWVARAYEVSEADLAKFLYVAADKGKIDETAVNKATRMVQTSRELAPLIGEPVVLSHLAPVKRIFGEDFMRVWRRYEVKRLEEMMPYVHEAVGIFHGLKRESLEAITKYREGQLKASDLSPQELRTSKRLDDIYRRLYKALEIDKKELKNYSPRVGKAGPQDLINWVFSPKGMEEIDFWANHVRTGELNPRELNAKKLLMRYIRTGFRAKYYNRAMEEARPFFDKLDPERRTLARAWTDYAIRKIPSSAEKLANRAARRMMKVAGMKVDENSRVFKDLVGALMDFNYSAFMGLRPKLALRNKLQEWLTFNEYGRDYITGRVKAWGEEISKALEKSDTFKLRKKNYLVLQERINRLTDIPKDVREAMMIMYRAADIDNVRVAFASGYSRAKRLGLPLEERIRAGEKAIHATQWGYGIDLPMLFQTTLGRAGGQYLSWPIWYLDHLARVAKERQGAKAVRMLGQLAALIVLREVGNIDYLRSFGLGVIPTRLGGYVPSQVINGLRLINALSSGDWDRIKRAEKDVINGTFMGLLPGYLAAKDIKKLLESASWKDFIFYTRKQKKKKWGW